MSFQLLARLSLGGSDLTGYMHHLDATHSQEEIDDSVFGDSFKNRICGLQDYQQSAAFRDDITDNGLDEILFALWGSTVAVQWGYLQSFTETANNPEYQYTSMLLSDRAGGDVGQGADREISFAIASGSVTRDVT